MWRRVIIILLVFGLAALLMVLKNKVFTGSLEIIARVERTAPYTYELHFHDLAEKQKEVSQNEVEQVRQRLEDFIVRKKILEQRRNLAQRWADEAPDIELPERVIQSIEIGPERKKLLLTLNPPGLCAKPKPPSGRPMSTEVWARQSTDPVVKRQLAVAYQRSNPAKSFWHIPLGIDLQGGVEFICSLIDKEGDRVAADQNTVDVLRERLDARGLTEPKVARQANGDVEVVIPGGTQADAISTRNVLETTGNLEIREVLEVWGPNTASFGRENDPHAAVRDEDALHNNINEPGTAIARKPDGGYRLVEGYLSRTDDQVLYPLKPEYRGDEPGTFLKLGPAVLKGKDIKQATFAPSQGGLGYEINVELTAVGGGKNQVFTRKVKYEGVIGCIAICLDGVVTSAPFIESPSGSRFRITGSFTRGEAENLQTVFQAGSLSVTPQVKSQTVVGASLGQETIDKGWTAMITALILVLASVLVYYRGLGLVAQASLVACVTLIYAVLVIFGATLTLPGIAGLVLTVGMAVDANILIFERMREEARSDVDVATCINIGYSRAFVTILDANLTTFIAAFILYLFGSGPVKGFGLTLMIGIGTSMFAAIYLGRLLTELLYRGRVEAKVAGLLRESWFRLPYIRMRVPAIGLSLVLLVVGVAGFFSADDYNEHFDIDFTGGHSVQVTFEEPLGHREIDTVLDRVVGTEGYERLRSVRKQPYFASFAEGGDQSRQWVFKTIDVEGAGIEADLRALESRKREIQLELAHLQRGTPALGEARDLVAVLRKTGAVAESLVNLSAVTTELENLTDRDEVDAIPAELVGPLEDLVRVAVDRLDEEHIDPLRRRLQAGTVEVKQQIRKAFAGQIAAEGDEVRSVSWEDAELTLELVTIDPLDAEQQANIRADLQARDEVKDAAVDTAEADGDHILRVMLTYAAAPEPTGDPLMAEEPFFEHLRELLVAANPDVDPLLCNGRAVTAFNAYSQLVQVGASHGVRVAKPFPSTKHFSGTVGDQTKRDALIAMSIALMAILLYIAARFEIVFGLGSVVALVHDVLLTLGLLVIIGIPIDLTVVAGLLAIIGYSLNDTIVVFDRIREVRKRYFKPLREVIDIAISQTMSRTIMTSLTTLVVVVILLLFGGEGLRSFSATLLIGLLLGTFSSIFIASPVVLLLERKRGAPTAGEGEAEPTRGQDGDEDLPAPVY